MPPKPQSTEMFNPVLTDEQRDWEMFQQFKKAQLAAEAAKQQQKVQSQSVPDFVGVFDQVTSQQSQSFSHAKNFQKSLTIFPENTKFYKILTYPKNDQPSEKRQKFENPVSLPKSLPNSIPNMPGNVPSQSLMGQNSSLEALQKLISGQNQNPQNQNLNVEMMKLVMQSQNADLQGQLSSLLNFDASGMMQTDNQRQSNNFSNMMPNFNKQF